MSTYASNTGVTLDVISFKQKREVLKFSYKFSRAVDIEGQIAGVPRGGVIDLTVKARNDGNVELLHWMLEPFLPKSGTIVFRRRDDTDAIMKTIEFIDAHCIEYEEKWEEAKDSNNSTHTEQIKLSCRVINCDAAVYAFTWV